MTEIMTVAEIRIALHGACARFGVEIGNWDVAQSRSSYAMIRVPGFRWSQVRVADHVALTRSLSGQYAVEILQDTREKVVANIEASLSRYVAAHTEAARKREEDDKRVAERAALIQAEIERRGLTHLTGEARKMLRKEIIKELANA